MFGLRWLCMHLWLHLIHWPIDILEKSRMLYKVSGDLFPCGITDSGRITSREGDIGLQTTLQNYNFWMNKSQFALTFTVGFLKLLSNRPIHIAVWGNFPFNPFRTKTPKYFFQRGMNLYCIIKLATEISLFSLQISKTWCFGSRQNTFGNPFQSKKLPICM